MVDLLSQLELSLSKELLSEKKNEELPKRKWERRGNFDRDCRERKQSEKEERMTAYMMVEDGGKKKSYRKLFLSCLACSPVLKYAVIFPMLEAYSKGITHLPFFLML